MLHRVGPCLLVAVPCSKQLRRGVITRPVSWRGAAAFVVGGTAGVLGWGATCGGRSYCEEQQAVVGQTAKVRGACLWAPLAWEIYNYMCWGNFHRRMGYFLGNFLLVFEYSVRICK